MQHYHMVGCGALLLLACTCGGDDLLSPSTDLTAAPESADRAAAPGEVDAGAAVMADAAQPSDPSCQQIAFPASIDLAEASGAEVLPGLGVAVVADSGNRGQYVILDPTSGAIRERGALPLDAEGSDDIEGLGFAGGRLYALTSSGWVRELVRDGSGFAARGSGYAIAPAPWRCDSFQMTNCGPNWEGLCLRPGALAAGGGELAARFGDCAGFAVAKRDGALVCATLGRDGELGLDPTRSIQVSPARTLAGCAIDERGALWAVTNLLAASSVLEITPDLEIHTLESWTPGSSEAVAAAGGQVYRFSDTAVRPSLSSRYRCR